MLKYSQLDGSNPCGSYISCMITPLDSLILVLGASAQEHRYSYQAARILMNSGYPVWLIGSRPAQLDGQPITTNWPGDGSPVHTVTVYLGPEHLESQLHKMCALQPRRVIFNPGTEHPGHQKVLTDAGIRVEQACTLVLLNTGQF